MEITDQLTLGVPISCGDLGTIYQPTIEELLEYGEYTNLFYPYMVGKKLFGEGLFNDELKDFDLLFYIREDNQFLLVNQQGVPLLEELGKSLMFFYKTPDVDIAFEQQRIIINGKIIIDRDNYDLLSSIILTMSKREKLVREVEPTFKSKRLRDLHMKLEKNREETRKRNAILMGDIINTLVVNTVRGFTYEEIKKMTLWQLYNNYQLVLTVDSHEQMMKYKTSEKFSVEDDMKHWSKTNKMQRIEV